jgi:hypothetical protein
MTMPPNKSLEPTAVGAVVSRRVGSGSAFYVRIMRHLAPFVALVLVAALASCARDRETRAYEDFAERWMQAQHDYCSTNVLAAQSGMLAFREWMSDPKHTSEPVMSRDMAIFKIDGRLFLLEEYLGDSRQAGTFFEDSMQAWNRCVDYSRAFPPPPHPLEPISSKEQLRDLLARQDKGLDVGWMRDRKETAK